MNHSLSFDYCDTKIGTKGFQCFPKPDRSVSTLNLVSNISQQDHLFQLSILQFIQQLGIHKYSILVWNKKKNVQ